MGMLDRVRLSIYAPLTTTETQTLKSRYDLTPDATDVSYSSSVGVGWDGLTVSLRPQRGGIPDAALTRPFAVNPFDHVELDDGGLVLWAGQIQTVKRAGRAVTAFEAKGYGDVALRQYWFQSTDTATYSAGVALKAILVQAAPLITISNDPNEFVDSGIPHTLAAHNGQYPIDIVQNMSTEGGGTGSAGGNAPYDWSVYDRQRASFKPRIAPTRWDSPSFSGDGATYWIDFDTDVDWNEDAADAVSSVTMQYTPAEGAPSIVTVTNSAFVDRWGIERTVFIDGGQITATEANQQALSYLDLHSTPLVAAEIRRSGGRGLRLGRGGECPPQLVRAGQWCQVGDQTPIILLSVSYNVLTGEFRASGNNYPATWWTVQADIEETVRAIKQQLNPITYGRQPYTTGPSSQYMAGSGTPTGATTRVVYRDDAAWVNTATGWKSTALA